MGAVSDTLSSWGNSLQNNANAVGHNVSGMLNGSSSINDLNSSIVKQSHESLGPMQGLDPAGKMLQDNTGGNPSPPSAPGVDPAIADQAAQQKKQADDFKASMPGLNNDLYNQVAKTERGNLAGQLSGIKSRDSSRGLLYSGMHQANELGAMAQSGSRLATAKASINTDLAKHLATMNDLAINSGMQLQQNQQDLNTNIYNQALYNMNQNLALGGAVGNAAGRIGGYAYGSRNTTDPYANPGGGGGLIGGSPSYGGDGGNSFLTPYGGE